MSAFDALSRFLRSEMRMSHVYQPVMIRALLRNGGTASREVIARVLLAEDRSQVEYYEQVAQNMVGRVLTNRGVVAKHGRTYALNGYDGLSPEQVNELVAICDEKVAAYLESRNDPWSHRRKSNGYVPGTQRYEVLKRAHFRCELCGTSAEDKALEVDHILPRNKGGTDDGFNLQALCYSCNATKRDRDDADLRGMARAYEHRDGECLFCRLPTERVVAENRLCFAIRDGFPVTELHTLIIPKRHVAGYFDLFQPELNAIQSLMADMKAGIEQQDGSVTGFNVGINAGASAGQTIFHVHVHLIPRRDDDVANPRGGVRGVIPGKQAY